MNKRVSFKVKIISIMVVAIVLVSIIGTLAYLRFSDIVANISKEKRPDMRLVTAKSLMYDVGEAENSVKSFSITGDTSYLREFYLAATSSEYKLLILHSLYANEKGGVNHIDLLDTLINQKFRILDEFLKVQNQFLVEQALDNLSGKLKYKIKKENQLNTDNSSDTVEKKKLLGWLFKKKKKIDTVENKEIVEKIDLLAINEELHKVKSEEKNREVEIKEQELSLIIADKKVTLKLKGVIDKMEEEELASIAKKAERAEIILNETNFQIIIFCFATALVLILLTFIIVNYIRFNNRYRRAMKKAKDEAEDLALTKEKFFANMSHEIRTPMNTIAGFTDQVLKSDLTPEQKEQLSMVRNSVGHLLYLINDVLDFSKLQAGKVQLENIGFYYKELLLDVTNFIKPMVEEKGLQLNLNLPDDEAIFIGDPFRLRQILLNLLTNSIKFTKSGNISVYVTTIHDLDEITFKLLVKDTGVGMNKKQLERAFKEFEQGDSSISRNYGGSGLGLSIVKRLVSLHRGTIEIDSKFNVGTSVAIEICYKKGNVEDIKTETVNDTIDITDLEGLNILIADDEDYNRKLLIAILRGKGIKYSEAANGNEAFSKVKKGHFDLVLMDSRMPDCDGMEATRKIRELAGKKGKIPIIAITAAVSEADRKDYTEVGMEGFISKPFRENDLFQEMKRVLSKEELSTESIQSLFEPESILPSIDFKQLKEISNGDFVFYKDMLKTFLESTDTGIKDIEKELENKNWDWIAEYAHKMVSPCRHLSAHKLYNVLKEIEMKCRNKEQLHTIPDLLHNTKTEFATISVEIQNELGRIDVNQKV